MAGRGGGGGTSASHSKFTIMNYDDDSILTETDKADLIAPLSGRLGGALTHINGTPIRLVRPFHETPTSEGAFAIAAARA